MKGDTIELTLIEPEDIDMEVMQPDDIEFAMNDLTVTYSEDHRSLSHRDAEDQHPMSAITGLESALEGKQEKLVSGVNIKTVKDETLLGSGNVDVDPDALSFQDIYDIVF